MKNKTWYTIEKHHKMWTLWKHHEEGHSVGVWGIKTEDKKKDCLEYAKEKGIKLKKVWK